MSDWQQQLSKLVYSTETGKVDEEVEKPQHLGTEYTDGVVRIARQTKGRKGKGVIVITGIQLPTDEFKALVKELKKKTGTGGAVKDDTIEIQGDDRERVKSILESMGYECKLAGG